MIGLRRSWISSASQTDHDGAFEMQPPFAEHQPEVIAAWEEAFQSIPPEKRMRKGELRPPTEDGI